MTKTNLKASFYTFGCRLNQAETALIRSKFEQQGYEVVPFREKTDLCIINSCTVTENAEARCRQLVRQILRQNPDTFIAIVGCYSQTGTEALRQIEGIDLIVGTQEKLNVLDYIDEPLKMPEAQVVRTKIPRTPFTIDADSTHITTTRANLKIQDGCNFMCSYCIIPFARGRARSRAFDDIRREALQLVQAGHKELVLTGVNIGTYNFENKQVLDVVKMLLDIPLLERLRISSIEATTIPEELLDIMATNTKLCPHLHIPLQSGSNKILKAMKRNYTVEEYLEFIQLAAQKVPDILLATDIIVGFPGETQEDFEDTCHTFTNSPLSYVHVFSFSQRQGTAAQKLGDGGIEPGTKKERSRILHQLSRQKKEAFYRRFQGKTMRVLTEDENDQGYRQGFTDNYLKVALTQKGIACNQILQVKLTSMQAGVLRGTPN